MEKQKLTVTFTDPNRPEDVESMMMRILVEKLREQGIDVNGQKIFISHGDCLEDALFVRDLILKDYPQCTFEINFIGPVIGAHSGPGTVALFFYGSKR